MRVQFHIAGSLRKAKVQADVKEVSRGQWEFRFLFVELEGIWSQRLCTHLFQLYGFCVCASIGYPPGVIVIEDNR